MTLFAGLCRARFWSIGDLRERLRRQGLAELSYVRQAAPANLAEIFTELFDTAPLTGAQSLQLRLLAALPYRFRAPAELLPYMRDLSADADALADQCQTLGDLSWLLRGDAGYTVHPLIAETLCLHPLPSEHLPRLWAYLREMSGSADSDANEALVSILLHMGPLNEAAVDCLVRLEQRIGSIPWLRLPDALYELHCQYLDEHAHPAQAEADYWLGLALRDIVVLSRRDRLDGYLQKILAAQAELRPAQQLETLYTVLEYASACPDLTVTDRAFDALRPEESESSAMADWLISMSVRQRRGDHDPAAALAFLQRADGILRQLDERDSLRHSNLDYRSATCLMDLGRPAEAKPLLENCLRILRGQGCADDAAKLMSTRSTYAVCLNFLGEYELALREYEALARAYRKQGRELSGEYAMLRNNTAVLLESMGRSADAVPVILEALDVDRQLSLPADVVATHHRNAALSLTRSGEAANALPHAEAALDARSALYGEASPWTADAQAVYAFVLAALGRAEEARPLIDDACQILLKEWGETHRHTVNALRIRHYCSTNGSVQPFVSEAQKAQAGSNGGSGIRS